MKQKLLMLDDLFTTQEERDEMKLEKIRDIQIKDIEDFPNHPFKINKGEEIENMKESIRQNGILEPALVRSKEDGEYMYNFNEFNYDIEQYKVFMRKTGLFELLQNHIINNLVDYCLGIETGLDSNGRKNRGGHQMENLVESYIKRAGVKEYYKEMYLTDIEKKWNVDLSAISANGTSTKRFDFVVKTNNMIYLIETNFYGGNSGGSKLNETARSYEMIAKKVEPIDGVTFVWITDGTAWRTARRNLEETFNAMDNIYSIDDLEHDIMDILFFGEQDFLMVAEEGEEYRCE